MRRKQLVFVLLVGLISGFLGGVLSIRFLLPPNVLAQDEPQKVITAERFVLKDDQGRMRAELVMTFADSPVLRFYDAEGETQTIVGEGVIAVYRDGILGEGSIFIDGGDTPGITIADEEGFEAILGITSTVNTRTGRTNQTSAASLILFGKDRKVIWSAP